MSIEIAGLPIRLQEFINSKLENGEQVLWVGQPIVKMNSIWKIVLAYVVGTLLILLPLSLIFYGLKNHDTRLQIGIIAAVIFFYIAYALFRWPSDSIIEIKNTAYLVTSKRAIVVVPARPFSLVSVVAEELKEYSVSEKPDGSGDIILKKMFVRKVDKGGYELTNAFLNIKEVKAAEMAIKQLLTVSTTFSK